MENNGILNIAAELIHQHPDNPRKDLGDLSELSESIKKKGIMQNLMVIPGHWDDKREWHEDGYTLIIGHRRFAAGKEAGLTEFPCRVVTDMDQKDQVGMMLEENMQRNDLTIWEQANGFQMMLDLGDTEEQIAEKTGFSKTTIKRRLNIAKLDQNVLKEKEDQEAFQLSLTDLYELEKIKDVETRNKVLKEATSSRDLARLSLNAVNEQKRKDNLKAIVAELKKLGIKKAPKEFEDDFYSNKIERMTSYNLNDEPPKKFKFEENGEQIFYMERYGSLYLVRKAKKEKKVLTPAEEAKKQNEKNKRQIKAILKEASNTRRVFIEGIISGRIEPIKETREIEAELFEQILCYESFVGHNKLKEFFLGCEVYKAEGQAREEAEKKMEGLSLIHKLLCITSAMVAEQDLVEWNFKYRVPTGEKVKKFYAVLEKYGFQFPNDEEKEVIEGTSDLYVKEA